jgi:formylglycine-generating enzyme required for sulfatase activity
MRSSAVCRIGAAWLAAAALGGPALADEVAILSFEAAGAVRFSEVPGATGYRVEWSPAAGGAWTTFTGSAGAWLDHIPAAGNGIVTCRVPMLYRVVATVFVPEGMAAIPGGTFVMGATTNMGHESHPEELPQHEVRVSGFFMDLREVTKALWDDVAAWASTNGYDIDTGSAHGKSPAHPVSDANWYDGLKWCNARSEREGLTPCFYVSDAWDTGTVYRMDWHDPDPGQVNWAASGYRLPTEAEWEMAARGGAAGRRFPWADADTVDRGRANYFSAWTEEGAPSFPYDLATEEGYDPAYATGGHPFTSPAGSFVPNGYGLSDMAGNVAEWCWDFYLSNWYGQAEASQPDPTGPPFGNWRVIRGGSWNQNAHALRVATRTWNSPDQPLGFRCVRRP